jgi:DNA-binding NarL/FixJ family response regulator
VIRILVADDHAVVRAGLEQLVDTFGDVELVATAVDGQEAIGLCEEHEPDVVLMDLEMPVLDGIQATERITTAHAGTRVVVLTSFADQERILRALDAGAVGYVLKDAEPSELAEAIRAAARGDVPLDPVAARVLLGSRRGHAPVDELSEREREILQLVGNGLPNKVIAARLGITERTVKAHLTSVFRTINVTDRTQAALWAERHGLLETTDRSAEPPQC